MYRPEWTRTARACARPRIFRRSGQVDVRLDAPPRDELRFANMLGALLGHGLARRGPDGLTIHRPLAAAVRRPLTRPNRAAAGTVVRQLLRRHLPDDIQRAPQSWPVWHAMLAHVLAATADPTPAPGDRDTTAWLLDHAAAYLTHLGSRGADFAGQGGAERVAQEFVSPAAVGEAVGLLVRSPSDSEIASLNRKNSA